MRSLVVCGALIALAACASPVPSAPPTLGSTPNPPAVDCAGIEDETCRSVAGAAELMTGTFPLAVVALPAHSDGGTRIEERYVVTLESGDGAAETQLVEVVRLEGSENWSARRLHAMPSD